MSDLDNLRAQLAAVTRERDEARDAAKKAELAAKTWHGRAVKHDLRARVAALEVALRRVALGAHWMEEFPDHPAHWEVKLTCRRCGAIGADIDHLDSRHREDCPTSIARAALGPTPQPPTPDVLMRVAEAVREACFAVVDFGGGGREGMMQTLRALDLRAIVAKVTPTPNAPDALAALRDLRDAVSARLTRGEDEEPGQFDRAWAAACAVLDEVAR